MFSPAVFVSLNDFAAELHLACATVRRYAGSARIPLFRLSGIPDALLRRTDAARLRATLAVAGACMA